MMAVSAWANVIEETIEDISSFTPTYEATQKWRCIPRPRPESETGGRDREFVARRYVNAVGVRVFGGGEDQLGRTLYIDAWYTDSPEFEDRKHCDEQDLIAALEPTSTYPTGTWGQCKVRKVVREEITVEPTKGGSIKVSYPVLLIWREQSSHI